MAENYWDNFTSAAMALGRRYLEESGITDVVEELARINDPGNSITDIIKDLGAATNQAFNAPLQGLGNLAIEADRAAGAAVLSDMASGPTGPLAKFGNPTENVDRWKQGLQPWNTYATAWTPPKQIVREDGSVEQAPGVFNGGDLGQLITIAHDRIQQQMPGDVSATLYKHLLAGTAYTYGQLWNGLTGNEGPYKNGTYVPPVFDIYAPDLGTQVRNSGLAASAMLSELAVEATIDPLNWMAPGVGRMISARNTTKLIAIGDGASTAAADILGQARSSLVYRRAGQVKNGAGLWSQQGLLEAMSNNKSAQGMLQFLAENKDINTAAKFFSKNGLADESGAAILGELTTYADTPEQVAHVLNAAAFRNVESIDIIKDMVSDSTPLTNAINKTMHVGDDIFEQAAVDFPSGSVLPDGHILRISADEFWQRAMDANPSLQEQWDTLAAADQKAAIGDFMGAVKGRNTAINTFENAFEGERVDQILNAVPSVGVLGKGRPMERAIGKATGERFVGNPAMAWLAEKTAAIPVPGGAHRLAPKFLLLAKPGLTFKLHGADAMRRLDQVIEYADGLIGSGDMRNVAGIGGTISNNLPGGYKFSEDILTQGIRRAFIEAGATSSNPEQARAALVNQLQEHVLARIAQSSGFEPEVALAIAKGGMEKARIVSTALNSAQDGYTTTLLEDGVSVVLKNHPSTVRQTANFIPLMDFAGVRKALHSSPMKAVTDPDGVMSVAKGDVQAIIDRYKDTSTGNIDLRRFGRTESAAGGAVHAVVDVLDVVNNAFKAVVLLRLGYGVRNIGEGMLATVGSGVGWLNVMSEMNIEGLLSNTLSNWAHMPQRSMDRVLTRTGLRADEQLLSEALIKNGEAALASGRQLSKFLTTVTHDGTREQLLATMADETKSQAVRDRAENAFRYIEHLKNRLAVHVAADMADDGLPREAADVGQRLFHADGGGTLKTMIDENGDAILAPDGAYQLTGDLDRPLSMTPYQDIAHANLDSAWTPVGPFEHAATFDQTAFDALAKEHRRTRDRLARIKKKGDATPEQIQEAEDRLTAAKGAVDASKPDSPNARWKATQERLAAQRETELVQMRSDPDAPWVNFTQSRYVKGTSENIQYRTMPKPFEGAKANPAKTVGIDTWGKEADFRNDGMVDSLLEQFPDMDREAINAAITGDVAAREKVSNWLGQHGIYRTVWRDSDAWGDVNVLVHPKGIGGRGLRNAVDADVQTAIDARKAAAGEMGLDKNLGLRPATVRSMNRGPALSSRLGTPLDPNYATKLPRILHDGGFAEVMDDAINTHVEILRRQEALTTLYQERLAKVRDLTKKRGIREHDVSYKSRYGNAVIRKDMLHGFDGSAYAQFASADLTIANTIASSAHRSDLVHDMRTAFLTPHDITPDNPRYFEGLANLLGRFYRDTPGASDMATVGVRTFDDIDPVVRFAMQPGDRERLRDDAVEWALGTTDGQNWIRTMGLRSPKTGTVEDALTAAEKARAGRGHPDVKGAAARDRLTPAQHVAWQKRGDAYASKVEVADAIEAQFNFVQNFMPPQVRDLFTKGEATADSLRAAYEANPWQLHPFNGAVSPTTAEYRDILHAQRQKMSAIAAFNDKLMGVMGIALKGLGSQPETRLLRHPVFSVIAKSDFQQRINFAEKTLGRDLTFGELNDLEARSKAFALKKVGETLYTLESRSTMDDYMRFVSPFFPAWINSLSRWGRFYLRNPAQPAKLASRLMSASQTVNLVNENGEPINVAGHTSNESFDSYLVLPLGLGNAPLINKIPGAREAMSYVRIPLRSLDVIFQGDWMNPGFGPLVAVSAQTILTQRDDLYNGDVKKWIIDKILPVGPAATGNKPMDVIAQFLPSSARAAINAVFTNDAYISAWNRNYATLLSMQEEGTYKGANPYEDANRLTRLTQGTKIFSALLSPVAAQQQGEAEWYAGMWRELLNANNGDIPAAEGQWIRMLPTKFAFTQTSTYNLTGGYSTSTTTGNQKKWNDIEKMAFEYGDPRLLWFTDNYQPGGILTAQNSDEYNRYSRRWQLYHSPEGFSESYRGTETTLAASKDAQVAKGWTMYDQAEKAAQARVIAQGIPVFSFEGQKLVSEQMAKVGAYIAKENPVWGLSRGEFDTKSKAKNAAFFRSVLNDKEWIAGKENDPVVIYMRQYLDLRDQIKALMQAADKGDPDNSNSTNSKQYERLDGVLRLAQEKWSADSPSFDMWIKRYFRNDVVSIGD